MARWDYPRTEEHNRHISEAKKGQATTFELEKVRRAKISSSSKGKHNNKGANNPMFGKVHSKETKLKIAAKNRRLYLSRGEFYRLYWVEEKSTSQIATIYGVDPETIRWNMKRLSIPRRKPSGAMRGRKFTLEHRKRISQTRIRRGLSKGDKNPMAKAENVAKYFKSCAKRPTKPEKIMDEILQQCSLASFKYNGDFSQKVMLNGLIPDFVDVNGRKQIMEVFSDYFHNPERYKGLKWIRTEEGRIATYKKVGWDCLVIWESELKRDRDAVKDKLLEFVKT